MLGPDHPDTMSTRSYLYVLRGDAGDIEAVIVDCESALAERVQRLGPDHPETREIRNVLDELREWTRES